jgi:hypothetical protein
MKFFKPLKQTLAALAITALSSAASAQIAGYNVLLVHGFQFGDLSSKPSDAEVYNRDLISDYWLQRSEGKLNWSSAERVEGRISEQVFEQAKAISAQGTCSNGCVIVLHSTGDQVMRHFLANQESWLSSAGYEPLNIVATIDFGGAGGGTDFADLAVGIVANQSVPQWIKDTIGFFLGLDLSASDMSDLGVVQDLTYSGARSISMQPNDIPRLRFSGSGGNTNPLKLLLSGYSDGVVPASSSCGSSSPAGITSCSSSVGYSGQIASRNGPSGLLFNHFPVLMSKHYDHGGLKDDNPRGKVTYVYNNFNAGGLNVDFSTYVERVPWWQFWRDTGTLQFVSGSDSKSMSRVTYDTFNN